MILLPLNSTKLHCFACLARTIELTSRTVRALSFAEQGEYHLVSLTLPCRLITAGRGRVGVSHSAVGGELGGCGKRFRGQPLTQDEMDHRCAADSV